MFALEIVTGFVCAAGAVGAVFWFTFRDPPPRRPSGSATAIAPNTDADYFIRNSHNNGHGGFDA